METTGACAFCPPQLHRDPSWSHTCALLSETSPFTNPYESCVTSSSVCEMILLSAAYMTAGRSALLTHFTMFELQNVVKKNDSKKFDL